MKVTMLEAREAALDGVHFVELEAGGVYDVPEFLAESYFGRGIAEKADADAALDAAEPVADPDAPPAAEDAAAGLEPESEEPADEEAPADAAEEAPAKARASRSRTKA